MTNGATKNRRLYPRIYNTDYYFLKGLRTILAKVIAKYFSGYLKSKKLLDYGCGDVPYKPLFQNMAIEYIACDIGSNPYADIKISLDSKVPAADETFDIILSIQVLEHVQDVSAYLNEASRLLKKNGVLLLSTHGWWTYHPYPQDLWRWTFEGLAFELKRHGFQIRESYWLLSMLAYSSQLRLQCFKGLLDKGIFSKIILNIISIIYQILMIFQDKIIPDNIGKNNAAVYFVVAEKRADI